jgi:predicted ATPase
VFRLIEAKRYRCLKDVRQELNPFEILVGANASGKSTFLDVIAFLGDFISDGLEASVESRTTNFHDLVWGRQMSVFEFLIQAQIPPGRCYESAVSAGLDRIQYHVMFQLDPEEENLHVLREAVHLVGGSQVGDPIVFRANTGHLRFASESLGEVFERQLHPNYSSLTALPTDDVFPATAWLRESLRVGVTTVQLARLDLERPSPPGKGDPKRITGAGLARSISQLRINAPQQYQDWLAHIRTALPDVRTVDSILREEDKHRYVMIEYENGVRVPAWMISEGTLRLLALTILAYLPDFHGVYLIEEPENGVHPTALETIYQSLSSVYDAQVLVASHSPVLLSMAKPEQILCFSKTPEGTKIVRGSDHPALRDWQGEVSLGTMVASGILG